MRTSAPLLVVALAAASLACSFNFDMPSIQRVDPGPLVTEDVQIERPDEPSIQLILGFAAGELTIAPGDTVYLVEGTASYNVDQLAPQVERNGGQISLSNGELESLDDLEFDLALDFGRNTINRWELILSAEPMSLEISGGAFAGQMDLGGLSLERLDLRHGAADVTVDFSTPNQVAMNELNVNAGAAALTLSNLGNARFEQMQFQGGAGDFSLGFEGQWQNDAQARIEVSFGQLTLIIPEALNVVLEVDQSMADVNLPPGFSRQGNRYTQSGQGPTLELLIEIGAGNLQIERP